MTNFEAKNGQYSRIFTQINWHELTMRQRCKNEAKKCDKRFENPFSNLSDSQFIENDRLDPILSFSINWESDRLEKEWIRAQIHFHTNFGAKKRAKSRYWIYIWTKHKVCSLRRTRRTSFGANYCQNQGIHSILRIHKSDPTETRKSRNWRSFGARMRSELDFITSLCCGGECDLKGC